MAKRGIVIIFLTLVLIASSVCSFIHRSEQDEEPITVYLWSIEMMNEYVPYVQSQLPDVEIQFVVGNNDLDYYSFLNENGELPDIITNRRFSLNDAAPLDDCLLDLSGTEQAGSIYYGYLENYRNADGEVKWLPLCGVVDGFVANRALFEKYDIPLPTDYASFVSACKAFEQHGIRGFVADFAYDYTCLEVLQGLSIPEMMSFEGQTWRHAYETTEPGTTSLDDTVWPAAFETMEQFIQDVNLKPEDTELSYTPVIEMFQNGEVAMIRGGADFVSSNNNPDIMDPVILPYFGQNGEEWLLTYPAFQVALNNDLNNDMEKKQKALRVLDVMLSEEAQNILANKKDVLTYSKDVELERSEALNNLEPFISSNHLFVRLASSDLFAISQDVVQKMIEGEYDSQQAYEAFNEQLINPKASEKDIVVTFDKAYPYEFRANGGNQATSVMANTLRELYSTDVLIAPGYSFTSPIMNTGYTEQMAGYMIMPNSLKVWYREMSGAELRELLRVSVEGKEGVFIPFNKGSLPTVSGLSLEVKEKSNRVFTLSNVKINGKDLQDSETYTVAYLNTESYQDKISAALYPSEEEPFIVGDERVINTWKTAMKEGHLLAEPSDYITLK